MKKEVQGPHDGSEELNMDMKTEAEYFYTHPDIVALGQAEDFQDGGGL